MAAGVALGLKSYGQSQGGTTDWCSGLDAACLPELAGINWLAHAVTGRALLAGMVKQLQQAGVPAAAFLPPCLTRLLAQANLRNHSKIMVVDGTLGFTGGMNISTSHWLAKQPEKPARWRAAHHATNHRLARCACKHCAAGAKQPAADGLGDAAPI